MRLNLGKSIKVALAKAGMSQRQLADQMKLSVRFITKLANSKTANLATVEKIAEALGMKASELIALGEE